MQNTIPPNPEKRVGLHYNPVTHFQAPLYLKIIGLIA
jgi:hypothetical protein